MTDHPEQPYDENSIVARMARQLLAKRQWKIDQAKKKAQRNAKRRAKTTKEKKVSRVVSAEDWTPMAVPIVGVPDIPRPKARTKRRRRSTKRTSKNG